MGSYSAFKRNLTRRTYTLRVRLTEEERKMLQQVAMRRRVLLSDAVRQLVREEHEGRKK